MKKSFLLLSLTLLTTTLLRSQNVGIGTTTPATRLHVADSASNTFLLVESPTGSADQTGLIVRTGNNIFNSLVLSKYSAGAPGTFAGLPKDNMSVLSTGGNAGTLLINNGNGVSPIVFAAGLGEQMRITAEGRIAVGTNTPSNKLHVHDGESNQDASIVLTNNLTGINTLRGGRFRFLNSDLILYNYEATGKIQLSTAFNTRLTIDAIGNVGIGTTNPTHKLDIENNSTSSGINIVHSGSNSAGISINMGANINNKGLFIINEHNATPGNSALGIHAISGSGAPFSYSPTINCAVVGECKNTATGGGVLGISNAPSPGIGSAGVVGYNFSSAAETYGVLGQTFGAGGAGVAGKTTNNSTGVLGYSVNTIGPAIKAECVGTSTTALEINNGAIKVSGTNKAVFRITAQTGINIVSNQIVIPNTTLANDPNDMLIVTPVYTNVYLNKQIGVWWNGANWTIFTQDQTAMPDNAQFNVLVVKQ